MEAAALIARYGYAAVFAGTLLEGETLLLLAGYSAHRGYLDWATVVIVAWLGATLGDQFWFALGRVRGAWLRAAWPALDVRMTRALVWVGDHPDLSILAMRFLWGLRAALPVALGMSRVSWVRFLGLNLASAAVWAMLVAGLGWSFGAFLALHAAAIHRYEHGLLAVVVILALLAHGARRWRERPRSDTLRP